MSNEWKDYLWDTAQNYLLENYLLNKIESCTRWDDGFLINGYDEYGAFKVYFVWLDEVDGWSYRAIK